MQPLLDVDGVTLQYKTKDHLITATYRVDFEVFQSDRFVLLGPSGCGKSTLLKAVGGYLNPVEGSIRLKGQVVARPVDARLVKQVGEADVGPSVVLVFRVVGRVRASLHFALTRGDASPKAVRAVRYDVRVT